MQRKALGPQRDQHTGILGHVPRLTVQMHWSQPLDLGHRVGAILFEQDDEWAVQHPRYMTQETIAPPSDDPIVSLPVVAA